MLFKDMELDNLNKVQKGRIKGLINDEIERLAFMSTIVNEKGNIRYVEEFHVITSDIVVVQEKRNVGSSKSETLFTAFVDGEKVIETSTTTLDGAIILAIAAKNGDANAGIYAAKTLGISKL